MVRHPKGSLACLKVGPKRLLLVHLTAIFCLIPHFADFMRAKNFEAHNLAQRRSFEKPFEVVSYLYEYYNTWTNFHRNPRHGPSNLQVRSY